MEQGVGAIRSYLERVGESPSVIFFFIVFISVCDLSPLVQELGVLGFPRRGLGGVKG